MIFGPIGSLETLKLRKNASNGSLIHVHSAIGGGNASLKVPVSFDDPFQVIGYSRLLGECASEIANERSVDV